MRCELPKMGRFHPSFCREEVEDGTVKGDNKYCVSQTLRDLKSTGNFFGGS